MPLLMKPGSGIERLPERYIARIAGQSRPHLAGHVGVSDAGVGSAKPRAPPAPGDPNERALPNGQTGLGFMKPSENCTSPFRHSS